MLLRLKRQKMLEQSTRTRPHKSKAADVPDYTRDLHSGCDTDVVDNNGAQQGFLGILNAPTPPQQEGQVGQKECCVDWTQPGALLHTIRQQQTRLE